MARRRRSHRRSFRKSSYSNLRRHKRRYRKKKYTYSKTKKYRRAHRSIPGFHMFTKLGLRGHYAMSNDEADKIRREFRSYVKNMQSKIKSYPSYKQAKREYNNKLAQAHHFAANLTGKRKVSALGEAVQVEHGVEEMAHGNFLHGGRTTAASVASALQSGAHIHF